MSRQKDSEIRMMPVPTEYMMRYGWMTLCRLHLHTPSSAVLYAPCPRYMAIFHNKKGCDMVNCLSHPLFMGSFTSLYNYLFPLPKTGT